jgi:hypothetical protein
VDFLTAIALKLFTILLIIGLALLWIVLSAEPAFAGC